MGRLQLFTIDTISRSVSLRASPSLPSRWLFGVQLYWTIGQSRWRMQLVTIEMIMMDSGIDRAGNWKKIDGWRGEGERQKRLGREWDELRRQKRGGGGSPIKPYLSGIYNYIMMHPLSHQVNWQLLFPAHPIPLLASPWISQFSTSSAFRLTYPFFVFFTFLFFFDWKKSSVILDSSDAGLQYLEFIWQ